MPAHIHTTRAPLRRLTVSEAPYVLWLASLAPDAQCLLQESKSGRVEERFFRARALSPSPPPLPRTPFFAILRHTHTHTR